ncbi:hypothetical protein [Desulforamulus ruminis]|uniref:Uncharacterized protein n=1 Tax=Desulforamulus ruminis (strain ATCC 23193 / DSM 2154 / NCIMB 8452 / DL) TaxID=696281 RepID=F6DPJ4_DESRL|nr:hypothetical protein [Desulforamulus ruminis]AEG59571.1 hypothetical protein Desru_1297 [Desulforamulus ruminis DSM 2154]
MSEGLLQEILQELKGMRTELTDVKSEMVNVKNEMTVVKSEMADMRSEMTGMKTEMTNVKSELGSLNQRVGSLEAGQQKLAMKIENEVIDKIRALFDDREMQNHRLDRIDVKLENIIVDLSYLVTKVSRLEKVAK